MKNTHATDVLAKQECTGSNQIITNKVKSNKIDYNICTNQW